MLIGLFLHRWMETQAKDKENTFKPGVGKEKASKDLKSDNEEVAKAVDAATSTGSKDVQVCPPNKAATWRWYPGLHNSSPLCVTGR